MNEQTSIFSECEMTPNVSVSQPNLDEYQKIVLKSTVKHDEYTEYIKDAFDLNVTDVCKVCIPDTLNIDNLGDWNIGVICGASGSGKSTILKHLAKKEGKTISQPTFDNDKCLISNFSDMEPKEATMLLSQMGLASVPTWIRPFNVLSNGEQYRASLAKTVSELHGSDIAFIDEYTSVVDRNVAKSMSNALQKYIRRQNKRIILATCHYDIFEWLRPDWIYDLNKGGVLERGDYLRQRRPPIEIQVYRTTADTWERFKKHHYITEEMNMGAWCYCFAWENQLVGFCALLANPAKGLTNGWRISRVVVLPNFQGLGLGAKICEFISAVYKNNDKRMYIKTVNPSLGEYFAVSPNWEATGYNGREREVMESNKYHNRLARKSYCYKYVGEPLEGYENLLQSNDKMKLEKQNENQFSLF